VKQRTPQLTALDTNVLARYYVQAEQSDAATVAQCEQARALFESGKPLFVATTVALELEWVLRGFYKLKPKTVADVLASAGLNEDSEPSEAFVLRADGSIFSRKAAGLFTSFERAKLMPGDTVVVPSKVDRESGYNFIMRGLRDWTQIFSNLGIGAAAIRTLRN
jgi:hypothetical protein